MDTSSLIKLFEHLSVEQMRGLIRRLDATSEVAKEVPSRPSIFEMARTTVAGFDQRGLVGEPLFDRLAELLPNHVDEVQRVRSLWEIQWHAEAVIRTAREDAETTANSLVDRVRAQARETQEALEIAVRLASLRTRELNQTLERATATERALTTLREQADAVLAGLRTNQLEAEEIMAGLRELSPAESEIRERKRRQDPGLFDTGEVRRPNMKGLLWPVGATITVKFIDGSERQHSITRAAAGQWAEHANLEFEFTDDPEAMVRLSFDSSLGSWAYVGTNALGISTDRPTMNLGWVERAPETALHELGHVLGLIHEWQNPNADIPWDLEAIDAGRAGHPQMTVEQNRRMLVERVPVEDYQDYRDFDPDSIMMFPIPGAWLLEGEGFQQPNELSESDKAFIEQLYPFPEDQPI